MLRTYMVTPFPTKAALQTWVFIERVDILLDISGSIAHCMYKLAQYEWFLPGFLLGSKLDDFIQVRIHPTVQIYCLGVPIFRIMNRSRGVIRLDPVIHRYVIAAVEGLIS